MSQHDIKQELVDAIRMLERAEYIDHNGHCSARRDANSFYINSGASVRGTLTVVQPPCLGRSMAVPGAMKGDKAR